MLKKNKAAPSLLVFFLLAIFSITLLSGLEQVADAFSVSRIYRVEQPKTVYNGIDVSKWDGNINWRDIKNSGKVDFAIIRTSYGWSNREKFTDSKLIQNINGAKANGIPIGAYHYSYATNPQEAIWEADFFISRLNGTKWEYPVYMDFEDKCQENLTREQCTNIVITFLERVKNAGYKVGYYTFLSRFKNKLNYERLKNYELWIAHWHPVCGCTNPYGMWQYQGDSGVIPGINKLCDLNHAYKNYPEIIKREHLNGY